MKRVTSILLIAILLIGVGSAAWAANGDTLNIGGIVPLTLDLGLTPDANADNLTLVGVTAGLTVTIAALTITTNNFDGWDLIVYSATAEAAGSSTLNNGDATPQTIPYSIGYTGTGAASGTIVTGGLAVGSGGAATTTETGDLQITYDQTNTYAAGYYTDQLTVVLRAK